MKITSATFGRTEPETKICLRPGNFNATQSESVNCGTDVAMKVEAICADQRTCFFNVNDVTFTNPCPADVYKYLWVNFECSKYECVFLHSFRPACFMFICDLNRGAKMGRKPFRNFKKFCTPGFTLSTFCIAPFHFFIFFLVTC